MQFIIEAVTILSVNMPLVGKYARLFASLSTEAYFIRDNMIACILACSCCPVRSEIVYKVRKTTGILKRMLNMKESRRKEFDHANDMIDIQHSKYELSVHHQYYSCKTDYKHTLHRF